MAKIKEPKTIRTPKQLGLFATKLALDKKAFNPVLLDVRSWQTLMDYILIVSAHSTKHAQTVSEHLKEILKKKNIYCAHIEGYILGQWILMDYQDLIVHVFYEYMRDIYNLEALWHHAPRVKIPKSYY